MRVWARRLQIVRFGLRLVWPQGNTREKACPPFPIFPPLNRTHPTAHITRKGDEKGSEESEIIKVQRTGIAGSKSQKRILFFPPSFSFFPFPFFSPPNLKKGKKEKRRKGKGKRNKKKIIRRRRAEKRRETEHQKSFCSQSYRSRICMLRVGCGVLRTSASYPAVNRPSRHRFVPLLLVTIDTSTKKYLSP